MPPAVLVIGGSGTFGSRLAEGLAAATDLPVIVAGRRLAPAEAVAADLRRRFPGRDIRAAAIDRDQVTPGTLRSLNAGILVDAAGPFQFTGLALPRAAIGAGIAYLDLADATGHVTGIAALDEAAQAAGIAVVAGASSTPALSAAVIAELTRGWRRIDTVEVAISPGNRTPRGRSVVQAILSYVGQPVRLFLDGRWQERPGFSMLARRPMGALGRRWLSLCDAPDLALLPGLAQIRRSAVFRAGLELSVLHLGLCLLGLLVRGGVLLSLVPFTGLLLWCAERLRPLGSDRGGMLVEAAGIDAEGQRRRSLWTLVTEAGDGPYVPTLPALALIEAMAAGRGPAPGARPAAGLLTLNAIAQGFARHRIQTRAETAVDDRPALFAAALGTDFAALPQPIKALHEPGWWAAYEGLGQVDGASHPLARLVARLFGFPPTLPTVPVRVTIAREPQGEHWQRDFGGSHFSSHLARGADGHVVERFGPFRFTLALTPVPGGLRYAVTGWRLGFLPLPGFLKPRTEVLETVDGHGRFHFDVGLSLPLLGRMVRYRGWLRSVETGPAPLSPHS